jgi:hypothetical protein
MNCEVGLPVTIEVEAPRGDRIIFRLLEDTG